MLGQRLRAGRPWTRLLAAGATAAVAGCGSGATSATHASRIAGTNHASQAPVPGAGLRSIPAPGPTGKRADPRAVAVIREWSDALRRGDVAGAAKYFALPSLMVNGPDANGQIVEIPIRSRAQAQAANATLPCGAALISTDQRGRYVNALFRLTDRPGPGGGCAGGAGQTARTNFVITNHRIAEWIRAPDDPGDNTPPTPATPSPPSGGTPTGPAV